MTRRLGVVSSIFFLRCSLNGRGEEDADAHTLLSKQDKLETFISRLQEALAMPPFPSEQNDTASDAPREAVAARMQPPATTDDTAALNAFDPLSSTDSETHASAQKPLAFLSPPQAADEMGRLNGYRVLKLLGEGGMGMVFEAEDVRLKRRVALKVMKPEIAAKEQHRVRFLREAQTAAAVEHDHICPIFQVGEENGVPFIAMPFLKGEPLNVRLKRQKPLPIAEAVRIGREVAEGLAAAHDAGLVHRDIKPGNIWLEEDRLAATRTASGAGRVGGRVKILDFGLARLIAHDIRLTQSGMIIGTPAYMAPEQARGIPVDQRADLFSLGVILYEMTTGKRPFSGSDTMSILTSLAIDEPTTPKLINPAIPADLSDLIMALLAKSPKKRPADGRAVAEALLAVLMQNSRPIVEALPQLAAPRKTAMIDATSVDPWRGIDETIPSVKPAPVAKPVHKAVVPETRPAVRKNRSGFVVAVAAALLVLVGGGFAAFKLYFETKDGTLVVVVDDDADVRFKKGELQIFDADGKLKYTIAPSEKNKTLPPGKYLLKVVGVDGVILDTPELVMENNGKVIVRVAVDAVAVAKKEGGKKDETPVLSPLDPAWLRAVTAMPADKQVEAVAAKLKERNPGFDGTVTPTIDKGVVTGLVFLTDEVKDISPVRALTGLQTLSCEGTLVGDRRNGRVADLSPLTDMKLTSLFCAYTAVSDLSPLKDMKLTKLICQYTLVSDLSPLKDMKLTLLQFGQTKVSDLSPLKDMKLTNLSCFGTKISDLSPLRGMPLTQLIIDGTSVSDLSPLQGMPLTRLNFSGTSVADLSPLKDMKLTILSCNVSQVSDLSLLKNMPLRLLSCDFKPERDTEILRPIKTLETINRKPAVEFWKEADAELAAFSAWLKQVAAMPAAQQVETVAAKLKERNPGFDGQVTPVIENGVVAILSFWTDNVTDLTPVRALTGLRKLHCGGSASGKGQLADMSSLKDMKLTELQFENTQVSDLSPLKDMKLTVLNCNRTKVADLAPLKSTSLTKLWCGDTFVSDLAPLKDMKLTILHCVRSPVSDLSPLKNMNLTTLALDGTQVADLSPLKDMKLTHLECMRTRVSDMSPLRDIPVKTLWCDFKPERDAEILRSIKTLETINGKPAAEVLKDAEARQAAFDAWLKAVAAMPAAQQVEAVAAKLKERNPGFDGKVTPMIDKGVVAHLTFWTDSVTDLSPVRALTGLRMLNCSGSAFGKGQLADLSSLKDLKLTELHCVGTKVSDLSPLKDMKLTRLFCNYTKWSICRR